MPSFLSEARTALIAFAIVVGAGLLFGQDLLFHAPTLNLVEGKKRAGSTAVVTVAIRVDGRRVAEADYDSYHGLNASSLSPPYGSWGIMRLIRAGLIAHVHLRNQQDALRPLHENSLPPGETPGPQIIDLGLQIFYQPPGASLESIWFPIRQGTAWPHS
jgi:hypothetical protein